MIAQADAVKIPLPDKSVHCCMTSPPYWGLRKYAGEQGEEPLGLEPTSERHVERMVEVFREVRRVLRDDGVVWLNYGDCYSGRTSDANSGTKDKQWWLDTARGGEQNITGSEATVRHPLPAKAGSLMMMPHRVALALQADGWIVRQDLVWYKRNPMPESVNGWRWQRERTKIEPSRVHRYGLQEHGSPTSGGLHHGENQALWEYGDDLELKRGSWRHTRAHEFVFMLCKSMQYWSNGEAIRERIGGSGVIERANSSSQFGVFVQDLGLHYPAPITSSASVAALAIADLIFEICILHSGAGFELVELKENIGLPFFDSQKWIDGAQYLHSAFAVSHPTIGFAASLIGRFASDDLSAKEFLRQLDSLWIALPDGDEMKELWRLADFDGRLISPDGDTPIGINDSGKISETNISGVHADNDTTAGRNPRSVLDVPTAPYKGAHYATFPPNLIAPLIRATCPRRCCPVCGQGWAAVVEKSGGTTGESWHDHSDDDGRGNFKTESSDGYSVKSLGYRPTCEHPHTQEEARPGIVFDPFVGSGTTVKVAQDLLRKGIGIDISMEYLDLQAKVRIGQGSPSNQLDDLPLFQ